MSTLSLMGDLNIGANQANQANQANPHALDAGVPVANPVSSLPVAVVPSQRSSVGVFCRGSSRLICL